MPDLTGISRHPVPPPTGAPKSGTGDKPPTATSVGNLAREMMKQLKGNDKIIVSACTLAGKLFYENHAKQWLSKIATTVAGDDSTLAYCFKDGLKPYIKAMCEQATRAAARFAGARKYAVTAIRL